MPLVRAVFFDMGGTLVHGPEGDPWRAVVMPRIQEAFQSHRWAEELYETDLWKRASPEDPLRQETKRWMGDWLRERGYTFSDADVERLRAAFAAPLPESFRLAPGATQALQWCRVRGLATAVLTNLLSRGDAEVREDCERFGLPFDNVVSSYSTGWAKPHRAMFERALALSGVEAQGAVMVGDDYVADIAGAKRLGLRAVWIPPTGLRAPGEISERPDAVIPSLHELPAILERWCQPLAPH